MIGVRSSVSAAAPPTIATAGDAVSTTRRWAETLRRRRRSATASVTAWVPSPSVAAGTSVVPAIVGVALFVVTDGPRSSVITGGTVPTVSRWVARARGPAPSLTSATTG